MTETSEKITAKATQSKEKDIFSAPVVSLPKGGGAIKGIGEKFAANPVTGTGSMTVPIAASPGRSGFGPQLSLSYDSGSGNGSFGFGWNLSLPAITRKTDKGLPQYRDAEVSDVFILSGSEDLVPTLKKDQNGKDIFETLTSNGYTIYYYRPRIEGLFARIERWVRLSDGDVHWRSISRDNILTLYGKDDNSRIVDPKDKTRVFSWLISETRDDKGNAILYKYKEEDSTNVDLTKVHERNRRDHNGSLCLTNRHIKKIYYGNLAPLLIQQGEHKGKRPDFLTDEQNIKWLFEVVFDYGEHDLNNPKPNDTGKWLYRNDPFSSYFSGFEVRNYRLCQRVLMFHHFPNEKKVGKDCLVRSTDFVYRDSKTTTNGSTHGDPIASFIASVTQCGYKRLNETNYLKKSLPPLEFEYSDAIINETIQTIDSKSLENIPIGIDGKTYQWIDLFGEGVSGIFTEQNDGWYYKRNLSPASTNGSDDNAKNPIRFGPLETISRRPAISIASGRAQFMDLAANGKTDVVMLDGPTPGFFDLDENEQWAPFRPFTSRFNHFPADPNFKLIDLNGDGHADVLISEDHIFKWYPSLAQEGFGASSCITKPIDEEMGPAIVFSDPTQSIYLADMSGDGLTDIVRIRNGEVCYWPNLGYGRFGTKVTMDNSPWFDTPDIFDQRRIRIADIDGSGNVDIIYLAAEGIRIYFNQSGNSWSTVRQLNNFPKIDNLVSVATVDLHGNGTACLVWSSPLPNDARQQIHYIDLMGQKKPHLLTKTINNLGAETCVHYTSSTKFYVQDKQNGKPWITCLPFPVYVVERVETYDRISRNYFVTRYAYHHGYYDGIEREFRGFGMVEQWDTEQFETFSDSSQLLTPRLSTADSAAPIITNIDKASYSPPVYTKTWFHTGIYIGRERISNFFAGLIKEKNQGEYYREPAWRENNSEAKRRLLDDTILPTGILKPNSGYQAYVLSAEEEREACRALKGSMLRQEIYALDGTPKAVDPYAVTEQNFTIECLQPKLTNPHSIFFTHAREIISYHYERNPEDPRVSHNLTIDIDYYGNVLRSASVVYGRRKPDLSIADPKYQDEQTQLHITCSENHFTNKINISDTWHTPLPSETSSFELTGITLPGEQLRFSLETLRNAINQATLLSYETKPTVNKLQKRLIEQACILYRRDDLTGALALHELQPRALAYESFKLAYTPDLVTQVFSERVTDSVLLDEGCYVHFQGDPNWWIPSGQVFYSPTTSDTSTEELDYACLHFFQPHRYRNPFYKDTFNTESIVTYDPYDLLIQETQDALGNRVTVGERDINGNIMRDNNNNLLLHNDYRVLQPAMIMDPNRNRSAVSFDALGLIVGTAIMGKPEDNDNPKQGDVLDDNFNPDLNDTDTLAHLTNPLENPNDILGHATTRLIYDFFAYSRTKNQSHPSPAIVYSLIRETHNADLAPNEQTVIQHQFSYSDGFGREIQKKIQAESGPVPKRDEVTGAFILLNGQPELTEYSVDPRWVGSGWTIFNNKGKPVRQYEPFFTDTHQFEFAATIGVSPLFFYDPLDRVVATLHPNHAWEKVVFNPWQQTSWDVNDTIKLHPRTDTDINGFVQSYFALHSGWNTWLEQRISDLKNPPPDSKGQNPEQDSAVRALAHADTPAHTYVDSLGRSFLTVADNGKDANGVSQHYITRIIFDIEGNQREVIDAKDRIVMRYDYDILGNRVHQSSMEAGERWILNDISGKPIRVWDSRGHQFRTEYDQLRRPTNQFVQGTDAIHSDPRTLNVELLIEQLEYGENIPNTTLNLRTRLARQRDSAGILGNEAYDFKGNLLRSRRQIAKDYKGILNWVNPVILESDIYYSSTIYDALNRPRSLTAPDNSIIYYRYNTANLLEAVETNLQGEQHNNKPILTPFVTNIDYDAKGQRTLIQYGNGAETRYSYDRNTFRLIQLYTRRGVTFTEDCGNDPPPPRTAAPQIPTPNVPCGLQNLLYTYDPVGNITHINDAAQQTLYFRGQVVNASNDYWYDPLYRLTKANGREHLANTAPTPHSYNDALRINLVQPSDGTAMGLYQEIYQYDAVGNFLEVQHFTTGATNPAWSRVYQYLEQSLTESEPIKLSNRLSRTTFNPNSAQPIPEPYAYDVHGNMTQMPHLNIIKWDFRDHLHLTQRQVVNTTDEEGNQCQGERTYYVYDAAGQRVRKITELAANTPDNPLPKDERLYVGGFEIYRKHGSQALTRQTLHIMDDQQRIALIETRTEGQENNVPQRLIRYQFGNHLGSSSLELDNNAAIISYEEYTPYGSTSYQAYQTETPKRYRYTGKERDEENGFNYHGARYYAPWVGRWISCDPMGITPGINVYRYTANNPMNLIDQDGMQECTVSPFVCDPKYYKGPVSSEPKILIPKYGELSPLNPQGVITTTHEVLKKEAASYQASGMEFGYTDIAKWKTDPEYIMKFKAQFVYENRKIIKAAALKYDLPAELVAGVVFTEIGGKDPFKNIVYWGRSWIPFTEDKDKTSLGQQATQVRRAAESLGYDPKGLTGAQQEEILNSLRDPSQSIFLAAKHLSDLRNVDTPGKIGENLTTDEIQVIGARYWHGPEKSLAGIRKNLDYGQKIVERWSKLGRLLANAPPKLEYAPIQNNIVKPMNSVFGQLEWEIRKLYGVAF